VFISGSGTGGTIAGISKYLKERNRKVKIILADPPGSALFNKVNNGVLYTDEDKEGFRLKHSFDTVIEGVGLNRLTANYQLAEIDLAYKVSD
jgi:cysteine synthase